MKRLVGTAALFFLTLSVALSATTAHRDTVVLGGGGDIEISTGTAPVQYDRVHSNGIREFGFVPAPAMSAPATDPPRLASDTARLFLEDHGSAIGILQNPSAFKLAGVKTLCDGSQVVTLQQSYALLPIHNTSIEVVVRNQVVILFEAAIIANPAMLPVCQPTVGPNEEVESIYYLPETTGSVVVIVLVDRVGQGTVNTLRDACTGRSLGTIVHR